MLESELGKKLREFIINLDDTYGDDTSLELSIVHSEHLYEALNYYSHNKFRNYTPRDIYTELIINELMCDDNDNEMVKETKRLVGLKQSVERVYKEIETWKDYRKVLVTAFIKNASTSWEKKLSGVKDVRTIDLIQKVSSYQLAIDQEKRNNSSKRLKKGLKFHFKNPS